MSDKLIAVRLDDPKIGAGPATVIACVGGAEEFFKLATDRDGAMDPALRMWRGDYPIGARVHLGNSGPIAFQALPMDALDSPEVTP